MHAKTTGKVDEEMGNLRRGSSGPNSRRLEQTSTLTARTKYSFYLGVLVENIKDVVKKTLKAQGSFISMYFILWNSLYLLLLF
jgi:hypothetical protein